MLRIGIAGVGGLGQVHLRNYLKMPDVRVAALADLRPERRSGVVGGGEVNIQQIQGQGQQVGQVESFDDFAPLCRQADIDVVCVALPTYLHAQASILAMEHGKHVLCEKPMALSSDDAQRMLDAAAANDKKLMIGQVLRFADVYVKAAEVMASGKYGKVLAATMLRYGQQPAGYQNWFPDVSKSGGAVVDLHLHDVDSCLFWWGKPDAIIAGGAWRSGGPNIVHSRWQYSDGPSVQLECDWDAGTPFSFSFRIIMERATLLYDLADNKGLRLFGDGQPQVLSETPIGQAYFDEDRYFLDCVRDNKPVSRCDPGDSKQSLELALETSRQMQKVKPA